LAYFNLLASVPVSEVERLRRDGLALLRPSLVLGASHLLAYWVQVQPLGGLLWRALDGGEPMHAELWHPLRPPLVHHPAAVQELAREIDAAWAEALRSAPLPDNDWLAVEVGRLLRLFRHAAEAGECVISALDTPADRERARRVRHLWPAQWGGAERPGTT
jgi:hypothetical protein